MPIKHKDPIHKARDALLNTWAHLIGRPAPKFISQSLLTKVIAFERQSQELDGLTKTFRRKLARASTEGINTPTRLRFKPGGRFIREWNGQQHVVDVTSEGYVWNGNQYRSLSVIARTITGAHWSGPRFFGVT